MSETKFETWGVVEIMGHLTIAGQVSAQSIAGVNMLRIDVPAVNGLDGYTKFFGGGSIYAITPTDEETARAAAAGLRQRPIEVWKLNLPQLTAPQLRGDPTDEGDSGDDWEDEDDEPNNDWDEDDARDDEGDEPPF